MVKASGNDQSIVCALAVNALVVALFHGCHSKTTRISIWTMPIRYTHVPRAVPHTSIQLSSNYCNAGQQELGPAIGLMHSDHLPAVCLVPILNSGCWTSLARWRHWETEHLPSPDRVSGTAFLLSSVIRHCRCQSSENCWKLTCLFKGRGAGDLWTGAFEMYWITN